jgi:F-type H+-transporting ATPase subunit b
MIRLFIFILALTFSISDYSHAETAMSPEQIEAIPFNNSLVAEPNTQPLMDKNLSLSSDAMENSGHSTNTAEKKAGLPQFDVTTFASQIFWLGISFVILYFFFAKKSLPALSSIIEERQTRIKDDLNTAQSVSVKVEKTREEYEEFLKKAHIEAQKFITDASNHLRAEGEKQLGIYKEKSLLAIDNVEKNALIAKEKIKKDLENISINLTQDIVKKIADLNVSDAEARNAIDSVMKINDISKKKAA